MNTNFSVTGKLSIKLFDKDMNLVEERNVNNLVVSVGKDFIRDRMIGTSAGVMTYMAIGTDSTTPISGDTTLKVESARAAITSSTAGSPSNVTYAATFAPGSGTGTIQEAGLFNASSSGTMLARTTFSSITKNALDTLAINWTVAIN
jgi:hypothetical protein